MSNHRSPPPQLLFDDGSRVMQEEAASSIFLTTTALSQESSSPRGNIPLHMYYEVERISREVIQLCLKNNSRNSDEATTEHVKPRVLRIALQFPDELLADSPEVCWLLDDQLRRDLLEWNDTSCKTDNSDNNSDSNNNNNNSSSITPFCFVLGDTTVNSCCPDEVAALHLNADVLVHYGHACLSPTGTLPVLYSFGKLPLNVEDAVQTMEQARQERGTEKVLILYQVGYHHAMPQLQNAWRQQAVNQLDEKTLHIEVAQIPKPSTTSRRKKKPTATARGDHCCDSLNDPVKSTCCQSSSETTKNKYIADAVGISCGGIEPGSSCAKSNVSGTADEEEKPDVLVDSLARPLIIGGLELPPTMTSWESLADYTILFIMSSDPTTAEDSSSRMAALHHRQYCNSMLCFLSLPDPPKEYWMYTPADHTLNFIDKGSPSSSIQRQLKRRFFLTQKARDANVFGILVSNLSQQHLIDVVQTLQAIIQDAGKASYSFAVGKVNPAKLANFAEIDVFCLVACREQSLLDNERDYPVPVITPMELDIALGNLEWGTEPYSLDCQDILRRVRQSIDNDENGENEDTDAPYYSLVTGRYESKKVPSGVAKDECLNLQHLPGQGQIMEYKSEAANFLKQREYHGLDTMVGQTEAKAAVRGLSGIASNYSGS
ncbi:DPH2: diphthamide biosynthesis protein 2 [Nitzschia inconspicua]|uniref:DPH2: diphthamide biosynthesis protein 2 n=1 Tax=Nitzschia inconspicua TaxID=303405 RepID=A0A9K3KCF3_9STRA|nr:DPH2: diphthamide biosynthesis protein 2 [Nitzschia inconspicua]KAG7340413.1 DPH2: diphthamide biosynthesis protein 2 [Nitzschia inconspicua]